MILRKILASVGVLLLFALALTICYVPFCVGFEDDVAFSRGGRNARGVFRTSNRFACVRNVVFWDIRKSVRIEFYVMFWIFLCSYVLFVLAMTANIWLKKDWLLFAVRLSAVTAVFSMLPAVFSRRFTLYRGNRIHNYTAYAEQEREKLRKRTAKGNVIRAITTAIGIPLLSLTVVYFVWYANLIGNR